MKKAMVKSKPKKKFNAKKFEAARKQHFGIKEQYPSGARFLAPGSKPLPPSYFKNLR